MAVSKPDRAERAALTEVRRTDRRSWLSQGVAALGISALGLAVAGSASLTSDARSTTVSPPPGPVLSGSALSGPGGSGPVAGQSSRAAGRPTRSAGVRVALVQEQAAQRSEQLAKAAAAITQASQDDLKRARQQELTEAEQARHATAAQLAAENLRAAVAARLAAAALEQTHGGLSGPPASTPTVLPGGAGVSPVPGAVIGAHFGQYGIWSRYHTGLDFRASYGTPIRAVMAGLVLYAGSSGDWAGNHVAVQHADQMTTMSSHMSSIAVHAGETVQAGQVIGYVGQTGRAFGAHLHFELYPVGVEYGDVYRAINPQPWLSSVGVATR